MTDAFSPNVAEYAKGKSGPHPSDDKYAPKGTAQPEGNSAGAGSNPDLSYPFGPGQMGAAPTPTAAPHLVHATNAPGAAPVWKKAGA